MGSRSAAIPNDSLFDSAFSSKGGRYHIEKLDSTKIASVIFNYHKAQAIKYIESFRAHESLKKTAPYIYFNYIDNADLNAQVKKINDETYLIGINAGTIFILHDLFNRILSNPNILKTIGDPTLETQVNPTLRNYYNDANLLVSCGDPNYDSHKMIIPEDKSRILYANHLIEITIDFLIAHELTHIANGHIAYAEAKGINIHEERNIQTNKEVDILTIQTLEMDADAMAISKGLSNAIKRHLGQQKVSSQRKEFYNTF